jgi:anti-sigma regulatory factor (Ser/Thr protein kinase)
MLDHSTDGYLDASLEVTITDALPIPVTLPASARSPSVARRLLRDALKSHLPPPVMSDVELLATELVTNAAMAAGTPCVLSVSVPAPEVVRVTVTDFDAQTPSVLGPVGHEDIHGRGLLIVDALAHAWGVEPLASQGKMVWFEVRAAV